MEKVILIDSVKRELREIEWDIKGQGLRPLIGDYAETAWHWRATGDVLFVDEQGLLKASQHFFILALRMDNWPLAGIGVVCGRELINDEGDWLGNADPVITIDQLKPLVTFVSRAEVDAWAQSNKGVPSASITSVNKEGKVTVTVTDTIDQTFKRMPKPD
jgi:hypothetical protein